MPSSLSNGFVKQSVHKGAETGHLRGLTFAVKDMYEVAGHANACGNPTWLTTHPEPAQAHAPCVQSLLDAGTYPAAPVPCCSAPFPCKLQGCSMILRHNQLPRCALCIALLTAPHRSLPFRCHIAGYGAYG